MILTPIIRIVFLRGLGVFLHNYICAKVGLGWVKTPLLVVQIRYPPKPNSEFLVARALVLAGSSQVLASGCREQPGAVTHQTATP